MKNKFWAGNEKRYGIYPLLERDQTYLLVLDFDNHDGKHYPKQACQAMLDTCRKYDINALPEVSSSGEGYHLWLFFSQAIPAYLAWKLGKLLLLAALVASKAINYNDFDRMIPAQDWLPKGKGFGNLIALPLKWEDVR